MDSLINKLYSSDFVAGDPRYEELMKQLHYFETEIIRQIPDCEPFFREYQNAELELAQYMEERCFNEGVRTGARLMRELMEE